MTLNCSLSHQGSVKEDFTFSPLITQSIYNNETTPEDNLDHMIEETEGPLCAREDLSQHGGS